MEAGRCPASVLGIEAQPANSLVHQGLDDWIGPLAG